MTSVTHQHLDKRFYLTALVLLVLVVCFWSLSRYPALDLKAAMSDTLGVAGGLSFESKFDIQAATSIFEKIAFTLINWIQVNKRGMLFGLAFSTVLLVLIPLIVTRLPQGKLSAVFSGLMLGIPMGLCVNCAAPIAYGLYQKKARAEMALVTMLSSPQLNIIVLLMAFTLFPTYLVLIKLALSLVLIIVIVPVVVQMFQDECPKLDASMSETGQCEVPIQYSWFSATSWLFTSLCGQGFWLLKKVVPLMLLAGLIGATVITLLPWQQIVSHLPDNNAQFVWLVLIGLALFALILPVPITFDVILAAVLYANDVPVIYIAILLFGLGSFSIYSWFVLAKAGAIKTASTLALIIALFSLFAGISSHYYQQLVIEEDMLLVMSTLKNSGQLYKESKPEIINDSFMVKSESRVNSALQQNSKPETAKKYNKDSVINGHSLNPTTLTKEQQYQKAKVAALIANTESNSEQQFSAINNIANVTQSRKLPKRIISLASMDVLPEPMTVNHLNRSVEQTKLHEQTSQALTKQPFSMIYQDDNAMGFEHHPKPLYEQFVVPFIQMNSMASGDLNNDGWLDIVVGTYKGVYIYTNIGGKFILSTQSEFFNFDQNMTGAVAIQDLNNDGWSEVIWSSDKLGGYIAYNQQGVFTHKKALPVDKRIAFAIAFDDVDGDGLLDILWGQYYNQWLYNQKNQNILLRQTQDDFEIIQMSGPSGSALTALFSDVTGSGDRSLLIGNEFEQSDIHYKSALKNDPKNWNEYWPAVPFSTMSISSADINNDLSLETYHAQITHNPASNLRVPLIKKQDFYQQQCVHTNKQASQYCQDLKYTVDIMIAKRKKMANLCLNIAGDAKYECLALLLTKPNLRDSYEAVQVQERLTLCNLLEHYSMQLQQHCITKLNIIAEQKLQERKRVVNGESVPMAQNVETGSKVDGIKQIPRRNLLYFHQQGASQAVDKAVNYGVDITGWAWNAKFSDLDGDTWQDLFIVNGYSEQQAMTTNVWYKNINGNKFKERSNDIGLEFYEDMLSYLYIDIDNDSDLDIVGFDISGRIHSWLNHNDNQHLLISLQDNKGNRNGIGAKVIIYYGDNNQFAQMREIKASGGFLSMDAPIAHFGLGKLTHVNKIEVITSTTQKFTFEGPFKSKSRYSLLLN